ncbi:uncharacterized protein LOC129173573 isoform X5 [Dunckerocampus dactyliophorus]|uniref:uncharacterized protein LOC129173573 isoform X5 n=1 Tax=Dunckerocampus dactyliophorus TaxID=161453 RepID=UPI002405A629|nr:uncharacterized protein LOC129173573 isoform X5 [Dunckerocampus dactyliophorus]
MTKWTYHMTAPPFEDFDEWHQRDVKSSFYVFSFEAQTSAEMLQLNCLLPSSSATRDSASRLLPLLLLVELLLPSWCRPAHNIALCDVLRSAVPRVDQLLGSSGHLHDLQSIDVLLAALLEDTLEALRAHAGLQSARGLAESGERKLQFASRGCGERQRASAAAVQPHQGVSAPSERAHPSASTSLVPPCRLHDV